MDDHVFPALHPLTRIRQNGEGHYLSSLLHRTKVQLDPEQVQLILLLDGSTDLLDILERFDPASREHALSFLLKLQSYVYIECFAAPHPVALPGLPANPAPHLQEVHLDITSACNLRCKHCYQAGYLDENLRGREMTTGEWIGLFDQLRDLSVDRVNLSGGEPLVRRDLFELIDALLARGIKLSSVFSNGVRPLEPLLEHFADLCYPLDFSISLDGPTRESHEAIRGAGTFAPTLASIRRLAALVESDPLRRYSFDVNTCVFETNVHLLDAMYDLVCELHVPRWRLSLPRDEGAFVRHRSKLEAQRCGAFQSYRHLIDRYLADFDRAGPEGVPYLQIESIFRASMLTRREVATFSPASSCCEYKRYGLAVKPNGDVLSCTSFQSRVLGNVLQRPLREIWYDEATQELKRLPVSAVAECADCELLQYCGTGCRSNVIDRTGRMDAKDELACEIYAFFVSDVLPLLERYGVECVPS